MDTAVKYEFGLSYNKYRNLIDHLVLSGKTTGNTQSDKLLEFTKLNIQRMNRLDKTIHIDDERRTELTQLDNSHRWFLLGDAWCGDCAQIIPVLSKLSEASNGKIELRIISRDIFPELIEEYKTDGAKSIPKLLVLNFNTMEVIETWGPRPVAAQNIMLSWKANKNKISWEQFETDLHLWYTRDKGQSIINELIRLVRKCEAKVSSMN